MKTRYSPESIDNLQRVVEFVEVKSPFAACRIVIDLQKGIDKLKQFPKIGLPVLKAFDPEKIRDLYIGNFTMRYLIVDEIIYILRIWHNKQNEKDL